MDEAAATIDSKSLNESGPSVVHTSFESSDADPTTFFTGVLGSARSRSEHVDLDQVAPHLQNAVVAIEDHRFFDHHGIDWVRSTGAAWQGFRQGRRPRGTSTLTQQLARNFYLEQGSTWSRKVREAALAHEIEGRWTKLEILERYLNHVPLGRAATFDIAGVGLAARHYFDKPASDLTLSEAALLAGMIQAPNRLNPEEHPEAARRRRHLVLAAMQREGFIDADEREVADREPLLPARKARPEVPGQFFVDAVERELRSKGVDVDNGVRVKTTVDWRLQKIVDQAAQNWGARFEKIRGRKEGKAPEIAIVMLDAETGSIRALSGGRSFTQSQFNRAYALRAPGSLFKPFVYAAALADTVAGGDFTPDTVLDDSEVDIDWAGNVYRPSNYHGSYRGEIPASMALNISANAATMRLASKIGYGNIVHLARAAGLDHTQATPSAMLGAYEVTPVQMAAAYAVFANGGYAVEPHTVSQVQVPDAGIHSMSVAPPRRVMDERAAWLAHTMLEGVMNAGTGSPARAWGFKLPAGGKTGTTRDSWFAGYSARLVCVVWLGYDDHQDVKLAGQEGALPVWTDVMKQATRLSPYSSAKRLAKPAGVDELLEMKRAEQLARWESERQAEEAQKAADATAPTGELPVVLTSSTSRLER